MSQTSQFKDKLTFTQHLNRIKWTHSGTLPRQTNYAVVGTVYIGDENRMEQLAQGTIDGTWERCPLARNLATKIVAETRRVLPDIDLGDPKVVTEIVDRESKFYSDPRFRAGDEGSTIAAGVARVIRFKTRK